MDPHFTNTPAIFKEQAEPDTPDSGIVLFYAKADGNMYSKDDTGVESPVTGPAAVSFDESTAELTVGSNTVTLSALSGGGLEYWEEDGTTFQSTTAGNINITEGNLYVRSAGPLGNNSANGNIYLYRTLHMANPDNYYTNKIKFNSFACLHGINANGMAFGGDTSKGSYMASGLFYAEKGFGWQFTTGGIYGTRYGMSSIENHYTDFMSGTNAQGIRIYNTYTSATNYERLEVGWAANVCTIETQAGGAGGTLRGLRLGSSGGSLLGFYGATPAAQPAAVADATDAATVITQLNDLLAKLRTIGIIAT